MKMKILVAGPKGSGKSMITNYLASHNFADKNPSLTSENFPYYPTAGVRIVEHEIKVNGINEDLTLELWDTSGDHKYENGWKALMAYTDGVILVYNPDSPGQDQQLSDWFDYFVKRNNLRDEQCLIFAHREKASEKFKPPPLFQNVSAALTGPDSGPDIKSMYENFVREVYAMHSASSFHKKVDQASSTSSSSSTILSSKEEDKKKVNMSNNKNTAYVFIKPHANNTKTQELVSSTLINKSITILKEGEFTGEQIDAGMLIDQHYYAIASKATILKPEQIPVPVDKFQDKFGLSWETALTDKLVFNAMDACTELGVDAVGLDQIWSKSDKVKFGGGFYCGKLIPDNHTPIYVFNAFFMEMRSKFVTPGTSIHYYVVEFDPSVLSWSDFRGVVLGPTDPAKAPEGSLRNMLFLEWSAYGLASEPNTGDNCVHASASPFEGLAERLNWLKVDPAEDSFGKLALDAGISAETLKEWSVDPVVKGKSIFDQLEDMDVDACLAKMVELAK